MSRVSRAPDEELANVILVLGETPRKVELTGLGKLSSLSASFLPPLPSFLLLQVFFLLFFFLLPFPFLPSLCLPDPENILILEREAQEAEGMGSINFGAGESLRIHISGKGFL